jgi:perosamine synthetase
VREGLLSAGIEARLYFPPAHKQPVFNSRHADLPNTDDLSRRMLSLPFHAQLSEDDLEQVAIAMEGLLVHQRHSREKVVPSGVARLAPAFTNREDDS